MPSIIETEGEKMITQELLDILACPKCKKQVQLNGQRKVLICSDCKLSYEIKNDIPIMLIDEAIACDDENGEGRL